MDTLKVLFIDSIWRVINLTIIFKKLYKTNKKLKFSLIYLLLIFIKISLLKSHKKEEFIEVLFFSYTFFIAYCISRKEWTLLLYSEELHEYFLLVNR